MGQRLFYIDYIRLFLCCVVIFHHTAIAFGASGGWYYMAPVKVEGLSELLYSIQMGIDQSYFMSLFFFISALFTPASADKKGIKNFLKDRFLRLGIPLIIYVCILNPLLIIYIWGKDAGYHMELGPLWFVFSLIFFELMYLLVRKLNIKTPKIRFNFWSMSCFALIVGLLTFVLRIYVDTRHATMGIVFANFVLYIAMYTVGIMAARLNLLKNLRLRRGIMLLFIAFVAWIGMLAAASSHIEDTAGGLNVTSFAYSVWEAISCVAISYFLLALGKRYFNKANGFFGTLAADSFIAFVIHPFPVVFSTKLMEGTGICPEALIPIATVMGILMSFVAARLIRVICHKLNYKWV